MKTLETDRLILREYTEDDDETFCKAVDIANRKRLQVWVDELTSLNDVEFIESLLAEFRTAAYLALKKQSRMSRTVAPTARPAALK